MTRADTDLEETGTRPAYFLAEHAYCCEFDDGAIILELRSGTYVGVHAQYLPSIRSRVHNWPDSSRSVRTDISLGDTDSEAVVADLLKRKILTNAVTPTRRVVAPAARTGLTVTAAMQATKFPPLLAIHRFIGALLRTLLWHGDCRLALLLAWIQRKQREINKKVKPTDPRRLLQTVMNFLRLRLWFYTADQHCLFDSLVLAGYLTSHAIECTFIIGVSTKPFTAHAWVQIGELVLNDTAEHVQTFTPILVVGV